MSDVESKVKFIIAEHLALEEPKRSNVVGTDNLQDDLGADSLDVVELVMAIEDEFNVIIEDEETQDEKLATVQQWVDLVTAKQAA